MAGRPDNGNSIPDACVGPVGALESGPSPDSFAPRSAVGRPPTRPVLDSPPRRTRQPGLADSTGPSTHRPDLSSGPLPSPVLRNYPTFLTGDAPMRFSLPRGAPHGPARAGGAAPDRGSPPSRRHFLRLAAGAAGLALAGGPARARPRAVAPAPIPGGLDFLGTGDVFHVYASGYPGFGDASTDDPSLITDFNGDVGVAYVRGMGTRTDKVTGAREHLPWEIDLRFMGG